MSSKPIGIFDSGVGGLTVMAAIRKLLPNESLIYLGDTARVPYGNKSAETILRYSEECCTFLAKRDVKTIVIACNTASAHALPYLTHKFHFPLLGVVEPGARQALALTKNKQIGVIGTEATVASDVYAKTLKRLEPNAVVTSLACPLFVPLVEEDWLENEVTHATAKLYLKSLGQDRVDTVILGCTHYPLLKPVIQKTLGDKTQLIDSAEAVALALKQLLANNNLIHEIDKKETLQIYVTDFPSKFEKMTSKFLGEVSPTVKKITL